MRRPIRAVRPEPPAAGRLERAVHRLWSGRTLASTALLPLAALHGAVAARRRARAGAGRAGAGRVGGGVPVVVVGNLVVGGTGKTPLVAALVAAFARHGLRCGIASRGHGGARHLLPVDVGPHDVPARVGDEPVMLARATGAPTCVCVHRDLAVARLAARGDVDVVLADDGLQHYAMARDVEVCAVDAARGFGNGRLLPAGPLREPVSRLASVDLVALRVPLDALARSDPDDEPAGLRDAPSDGVPRVRFAVVPDGARRLGTGEAVGLERYRGRSVRAVAGIGRPEGFFDALRERGIDVVEHPFPDHRRYTGADVDFGDALPVLVTSKDAVKLGALVPVPPGVVEVSSRALLSDAFAAEIERLAERFARGRTSARPAPLDPPDPPAPSAGREPNPAPRR